MVGWSDPRKDLATALAAHRIVLGEQTQQVTVGPKDSKTVDQTFKAAGM